MSSETLRPCTELVPVCDRLWAWVSELEFNDGRHTDPGCYDGYRRMVILWQVPMSKRGRMP